ncbi:hypothetical protein FQA39_LY17636 [Lamprigera yunnana]|nr:hypothetical protein FQA39_LY17636 [Lamprigera yunnana]
MDQSMEKIQSQFFTIQERINEKWEKKYVEVDNKMEEIQEQVNNNSGEINGICERLREQGTKLINVEVKINEHKEERIQVFEDLKEQKREIVNYIEEKIKLGKGINHNNNNRKQRFQDNGRCNNYRNGQYGNTYRSREQTREERNDGTFKRYENENENNRSEEEEPEKHMGKEININNVNIRRDAENDNLIGENGIKEEMSDKDKYCIRNNRYKENYEEKKA